MAGTFHEAMRGEPLGFDGAALVTSGEPVGFRGPGVGAEGVVLLDDRPESRTAFTSLVARSTVEADLVPTAPPLDRVELAPGVGEVAFIGRSIEESHDMVVTDDATGEQVLERPVALAERAPMVREVSHDRPRLAEASSGEDYADHDEQDQGDFREVRDRSVVEGAQPIGLWYSNETKDDPHNHTNTLPSRLAIVGLPGVVASLPPAAVGVGAFFANVLTWTTGALGAAGVVVGAVARGLIDTVCTGIFKRHPGTKSHAVIGGVLGTAAGVTLGVMFGPVLGVAGALTALGYWGRGIYKRVHNAMYNSVYDDQLRQTRKATASKWGHSII